MKLSIAIVAVLFPLRLALLPFCKAADVNAQDPGLDVGNAFMLPINMATCPDGMKLQLDRALDDLDNLTTLGLYTLLNKPCSSSIQHYFGNTTDEADLTVPIGVLTRLQKGTKKRVMVRCDGIEKVCSNTKQVAIEGGYVMRAKDGTSSVMICPQNFLHRYVAPPPLTTSGRLQVADCEFTLSEPALANISKASVRTTGH